MDNLREAPFWKTFITYNCKTTVDFDLNQSIERPGLSWGMACEAENGLADAEFPRGYDVLWPTNHHKKTCKVVLPFFFVGL